MKKLGIWRQRPRDKATGAAAPAEVAVGAPVEAASAATAGAPSPAAPRAIDDERQLLRQAAQLQHEDTVPAAFYRAHAEPDRGLATDIAL